MITQIAPVLKLQNYCWHLEAKSTAFTDVSPDWLSIQEYPVDVEVNFMSRTLVYMYTGVVETYMYTGVVEVYMYTGIGEVYMYSGVAEVYMYTGVVEVYMYTGVVEVSETPGNGKSWHSRSPIGVIPVVRENDTVIYPEAL